jgi:hypothetical protein
VDANANERTLLRYLALMDSGEHAAALEIFVDNVVYIRPATAAPPGAEPMALLRLEGRGAVAASWRERAKRSVRHDVFYTATTGAETFIEGSATIDGRPSVPFLCHTTFDSDGHIARLITIR